MLQRIGTYLGALTRGSSAEEALQAANAVFGSATANPASPYGNPSGAFNGASNPGGNPGGNPSAGYSSSANPSADPNDRRHLLQAISCSFQGPRTSVTEHTALTLLQVCQSVKTGIIQVNEGLVASP